MGIARHRLIVLALAFLFAAPVSSVAQPNPSGSGIPVRVIHNGSATMGDVVAFAVYDLTFTDLPLDTDGLWSLRRPSDGATVQSRYAYDDGAHEDRRNVTFPSISFSEAGIGTWRIASGAYSYPFSVVPASGLAVSLSQDTFAPGSQISYVVTVTIPRQGGAPAAGARLYGQGIPAGATTGANGQYIYQGPAPAPGAHSIDAGLDSNGDGVADDSGSTMLYVTSGPIFEISMPRASLTSDQYVIIEYDAWNNGTTGDVATDVGYQTGTSGPITVLSSPVASIAGGSWMNFTTQWPADPGTYTVFVRLAGGPWVGGPTVVVQARALPTATHLLSSNLVPAGAPTTVRVAALDAAGGRFQGAAMRLCGPILDGCTPDVVTDSYGEAAFHVTPNAPGYLTAYVNGTQGVSINVVDQLAIDVVPGAPHSGESVSFRVFVQRTQRPVFAAAASLGPVGSPSALRTDAAGVATFGRLAAGSHTVSAWLDSPHHLAASRAFQVTSAPAPDVSLTRLDLPPSFAPQTPFRGFVTVGNSGAVEGAAFVRILVDGSVAGTLSFPIAARALRTEPFDVVGLAPGSHEVRVELSGGNALVQPIFVPAPEDLPALRLVLVPESPRAGEAFQVKTVAPSGQPVPGAKLTVTRQGAIAYDGATGEDGTQLLDLPEGEHVLEARRDGYAPALLQVAVAPARDDFVVESLAGPSAAAAGERVEFVATVRNRGGAGAQTIVLLVDGTLRNSTLLTLAAGQRETVALSFVPTQAGAHALEARPQRGEAATARLDVSDVAIEPASVAPPSVEGTIQGATPADLAGAALVFLQEHDGVLKAVGSAIPGADGAFQAGDLAGAPTDALLLKNGHAIFRDLVGEPGNLSLTLPPGLGGDALNLTPAQLAEVAHLVQDARVFDLGNLSRGVPAQVDLGGFAGLARIAFQLSEDRTGVRLVVANLSALPPGVPAPRVDASAWLAITLADADGALPPVDWVDVSVRPDAAPGDDAVLAHFRLADHSWEVLPLGAQGEDGARTARSASLSIFAIAQAPAGPMEGLLSGATTMPAVPILGGALLVVVAGAVLLAGRPALRRLRRRDAAQAPTPAGELPRRELVLSGVSVELGGAAILHDVSFSLSKGELLVLLGPSGSGKSTTLKTIIGEIAPVRGEVDVFGLDPARDRAALQRAVGYVSQTTELYPDLTVRENVEYFARQYGGLPAERVDAILGTLGLADRADAKLTALSGGQQRRASIAATLAASPAVLVLDEPTTGLDPTTRRTLWRFVRQAARDLGVSVLVTTHFLEEAELADRVVVLSHGRVVAHGAPDDLVRALPGGGAVVAATLRELPADKEPALAQALAGLARDGVIASHTHAGLQVRLFTADPAGATRALLDALERAGLFARKTTAEDADMHDVFAHVAGEPFEGSA